MLFKLPLDRITLFQFVLIIVQFRYHLMYKALHYIEFCTKGDL